MAMTKSLRNINALGHFPTRISPPDEAADTCNFREMGAAAGTDSAQGEVQADCPMCLGERDVDMLGYKVFAVRRFSFHFA